MHRPIGTRSYRGILCAERLPEPKTRGNETAVVGSIDHGCFLCCLARIAGRPAEPRKAAQEHDASRSGGGESFDHMQDSNDRHLYRVSAWRSKPEMMFARCSLCCGQYDSCPATLRYFSDQITLTDRSLTAAWRPVEQLSLLVASCQHIP